MTRTTPIQAIHRLRMHPSAYSIGHAGIEARCRGRAGEFGVEAEVGRYVEVLERGA